MMQNAFKKMLSGYQQFRQKYAQDDDSIMKYLADYGQKPQIMVVSCCDSRVDPAVILQCDPGDLFVVRNVANIIPPYEKDAAHHGVSAALEFGITFLQVKHLILLGHSQCGGVQMLLNNNPAKNDFISSWVSLIENPHIHTQDADLYAQSALKLSLQHCLSFPWIKEKVDAEQLAIHLWFFDVKQGQISTYSEQTGCYQLLDDDLSRC